MPSQCHACEGWGEIICPTCKGDEAGGWFLEDCEDCEGDGLVACVTCDGRGMLEVKPLPIVDGSAHPSTGVI